jgi:DNA modification methylase
MEKDMHLQSKHEQGIHGTFSPNKLTSVHRWYPYLEGFSATFVRDITSRWAKGRVQTVYDPFGGTGTTVAVAAENGIRGLYSEINPFMQHVIETKTNVLRRIANDRTTIGSYLQSIANLAPQIERSLSDAQEELSRTFPKKQYFTGRRLIEILALRDAINEISSTKDVKMLGQLALASIGVPSSEMKRQADLRYRTEREQLPSTYSVYQAFSEKSHQIAADINPTFANWAEVFPANANAIEISPFSGEVDFIVTSPPYLNGTNYFRNTKLELWLAGYIKHENQLSTLTQQAMIAGINNVSKASRPSKSFDFVELVAEQLDKVAYDKRIPALVRGYCSDTELWLQNCIQMMRPGARIVIDIGDSCFAGVHVPTDEFIVAIARNLGLHQLGTDVVRVRRSKDGSILKQVLLAFEKSTL